MDYLKTTDPLADYLEVFFSTKVESGNDAPSIESIFNNRLSYLHLLE
jgi:hypothetical protein